MWKKQVVVRYLFDRVRCSSEKKRSRCPERRTGTQAVKPDVQLAAQPALLEGHTVASEEGRFFSARVCRRPKDIPACCAADDAARCTERSAMTNVASSGPNSCCQMRRQELSRMRREMGRFTCHATTSAAVLRRFNILVVDVLLSGRIERNCLSVRDGCVGIVHTGTS